jgi:uncharacterized protein with GYD domain
MLFCLMGEYTPQALTAMRSNPNTNRQQAAEQLVEAAGGKLISVYGTMRNGPGVMAIFDVPDSTMGPAIAGVAQSSGAFQNLQFMRLATMQQVATFRQNAAKIAGAYKPPGQ